MEITSITLNNDALDALKYLRTDPMGFNLSRFVHDHLKEEALKRGWIEKPKLIKVGIFKAVPFEFIGYGEGVLVPADEPLWLGQKMLVDIKMESGETFPDGRKVSWMPAEEAEEWIKARETRANAAKQAKEAKHGQAEEGNYGAGAATGDLARGGDEQQRLPVDEMGVREEPVRKRRGRNRKGEV